MQDPGTLLVIIAVEETEQIRRRAVDDRPLGLLAAEDLVGLRLHPGTKGAVAVGVPLPE